MKKKSLLALMCAGILILTACGTKKEMSETDHGKIKVGVVQFVEHPALDRAREGFIEGLKDEGFEVEEAFKNASGDISLTNQIPKSLESEKVDLIYAIATPAAQGAKNAVKDIPIIFNAVTDPVSANLVDSNEKPGKNVTGVSDYIGPKSQLETFLKVFPEIKTIGTIYSTSEANSESQVKELEAICKEMNLEFKAVGVNNINDVSQAMTSLVKDIDGFFSITDNMISSSVAVVAKKLEENKIPSFAAEQGPVEGGILMTDGIDYEKLGREAAIMAKEIMEGKSPAEIPVYFETETKMSVNKKVAEALGLNIDQEIFKDANIVGE